jgi:hypothetical protein
MVTIGFPVIVPALDHRRGLQVNRRGHRSERVFGFNQARERNLSDSFFPFSCCACFVFERGANMTGTYRAKKL